MRPNTLEVLLNSASHIGGWTAKQIHHAVITTFDLSDSTYRLDQLRYDLRKLKSLPLRRQGPWAAAARRLPLRLSSHPQRGSEPAPAKAGVALLFLFFHKRLCGPLANSRFHHRPNPQHQPASKLQAAYHRADKAIQQIVDRLAA